MPPCLQSYIDLIGTAFTEDRVEDIVPLFTAPLPVYRGGALFICLTPDEIMSRLRHYRDLAVSEGLVRVSGKLVAQSIPRNGRVQVWVDWSYDFGRARPARTSAIRYYGSQFGRHFVCNVLEYRTPAFDSNFPETAEKIAVGY